MTAILERNDLVRALASELKVTPLMTEEIVANLGGTTEQKIELEAEAFKALEAEEEELKVQLEQVSANINRMLAEAKAAKEVIRTHIHQTMEAENLTKVGVVTKVILALNPKPTITFAGEATELPEILQKVEITLDKDMAIALWKGKKLPSDCGVTIEQKKHVRVR